MGKTRCYRVGELAHRCDVNPRTIDYYTTAGLLTPTSRSQGGHRFYGEESIHRLRSIKILQGQGMSLEQIRARLAEAGASAELLPRVEHLREELCRLEGEVSSLTPQLATMSQGDDRTRTALRTSIAASATYALTLAQELLALLNRGVVG